MRDAVTFSDTASVNRKFTVAQRLARTLKTLFEKHKASLSDLAAYSQKRPGGARIARQNLSYFMHGHRKHPIGLNDLDDIAAFFNTSIGELFNDVKGQDLSAEEQRIVLAYRAMPRETKQHVIALMEVTASSSQSGTAPTSRSGTSRTLHQPARPRVRPQPTQADANGHLRLQLD